jgi:hypothetical protein
VSTTLAPPAAHGVEPCVVLLSAAQIGDFTFVLRGCGAPPAPAPPLRVFATVGATSSAAVTGRNPVGHAVSVMPHLDVTRAAPDASQVLRAAATGAREGMWTQGAAAASPNPVSARALTRTRTRTRTRPFRLLPAPLFR